MINNYVFISYSRRDSVFIERLTEALRTIGVRSWTDIENIDPGTNWQIGIEKGLKNASMLIYVSSKNSVSSHWMNKELQDFLRSEKRVIPIVIDDEGASLLPFPLSKFQWADFRGDFSVAFQKLLEGIHFLQQSEPIARPELKSKGYVFISYADEDSQFVERLETFLGDHGYAYWDFKKSARNYDVDYSLELESWIKNAAGMLSVISPNWKQSQISLQEFHFSKQVETPVFLLKVGDLGPTLLLSGLTYIDFTHDLDKGFSMLNKELERKGL
jgi:hypothetical protein